jgi:hypothetical protein
MVHFLLSKYNVIVHLMVFPMETSRVQIHYFTTIKKKKKKNGGTKCSIINQSSDKPKEDLDSI